MSRVLPILFNTEMVRAILDGRKTVTRRCVKHDVNPILNSTYRKEHPEVEDKQIISKLCLPPYQPGYILYARETWCDDRQFTHNDMARRYFYRADGMYPKEGDYVYPNVKWRPSIHMPKEAARIWLKVTDVRVERLQDMTHVDFMKEGIDTCKKCITKDLCLGLSNARVCYLQSDFIDLWDSTLKKSDLARYGWEANPWVWVIEFERCEKPEREG